MPKVKWSDANMIPMPDGTIVRARIDKVVYVAASKASGQPMFNVNYQVLEPDEYENRKLFRSFSLQSDSLWALKQMAIRFGAPDDMFDNDNADTDDIALALTDLEGYIEVDVHEYPKDSGEFRNGIKKFLKEPAIA